ncbi:MAG: CvpA family protein [Bdellovibrionota bacterium]
MNPIDIILVAFIGTIAIFGMIRGVVSQAMSITGLAAAYFFSAQLSDHIVAKIASVMGSSEVYARPFAVLWAAILIYIGCRLIGFGIEKLLVDQSDSLKAMNRIGGGVLGAIKGILILILAFYILRLVPQNQMESHAPKVLQSKMYQFFSKNELLNPKYIDTLIEPVTKSAQELVKPAETTVETPAPKSVTESKSKKTLEKTEAKMNQQQLDQVLQKHTPPAKQPKKK